MKRQGNPYTPGRSGSPTKLLKRVKVISRTIADLVQLQ